MEKVEHRRKEEERKNRMSWKKGIERKRDKTGNKTESMDKMKRLKGKKNRPKSFKE